MKYVGHGETIEREALEAILEAEWERIRSGDFADYRHNFIGGIVKGAIPKALSDLYPDAAQRFAARFDILPQKEIDAIKERASCLIPSALHLLGVTDVSLRDSLIYKIVFSATVCAYEQEKHNEKASRSQQKKQLKKIVSLLDSLIGEMAEISDENANNFWCAIELWGDYEPAYKELLPEFIDQIILYRRLCGLCLADFGELGPSDGKAPPAFKSMLARDCILHYRRACGELPKTTPGSDFETYLSWVFEIATGIEGASLPGVMSREIRSTREMEKELEQELRKSREEKLEEANAELRRYAQSESLLRRMAKSPYLCPADRALFKKHFDI